MDVPTLVTRSAGSSDLSRQPGLQTGTIRVNGVAITRPLLALRVAGYVQHAGGARLAIFTVHHRYVKQMDQLPMHLTVAEALDDAVRLNSNKHVPKAERQSLVQDMLQGLGLLHMAHHPISALSGGQLKRVVIAAGALLKGARIMLLDEVRCAPYHTDLRSTLL